MFWHEVLEAVSVRGSQTVASKYLAIADGVICDIVQIKLLLRGKSRLSLKNQILAEYIADAFLISLGAIQHRYRRDKGAHQLCGVRMCLKKCQMPPASTGNQRNAGPCSISFLRNAWFCIRKNHSNPIISSQLNVSFVSGEGFMERSEQWHAKKVPLTVS